MYLIRYDENKNRNWVVSYDIPLYCFVPYLLFCFLFVINLFITK